MGLYRHQPLRVALTLTLAAAVWLSLAPMQLGGPAAYVIVNGNSMEPGMRRGDLAILRRATHYAPGEVVTYRHPTIGPVIHRIIGLEGDRFVFQGDNNDFIDSYRPTADELIGRLWLHIPRVGVALQFLRQPPIFALLVALVLGTATMSSGQIPLSSRRRRAATPTNIKEGAGAIDRVTLLNHALTVLLLLGLAAVGLGALAFSRPSTYLASEALPFTQHAELAYSADAPADLYDEPQVRTGDPIFRRVSETMVVQVSYRLESDRPHALAGEAQLLAELSDGDGWRRTLPLGPVIPFAGDTVSLSGTLAFAEIQRLIERFENQTGTSRGSYSLALLPQVQIQGMLGGAQIAERFEPRMEFVLDAQRLRPAQSDAEPQVAQAGSLSVTRERPATLRLWVLQLDVLTARRLALAGLEIALVGGLLVGWGLARALRHDKQAAIRLRYGSLLVRVHADGPWAQSACELRAIEDLARLAERLGQPILVVESGSTAGYYVRDGERLYRVALQATN
jgi:signal peptidase I